MIVLGVDPGLSAMGYGVVKAEGGAHEALDWGVIHTQAKTTLSSRLLVLYTGISAVINQYQPDIMACEGLIFAQNVQSALALGQARAAGVNQEGEQR
ncbi:MAG TPA: crossover junction endodeoxyribonuclease RuvC, partial [bacterium]|nr:crossover junction endodeoxyribonuclease RuvC [bacterium]